MGCSERGARVAGPHSLWYVPHPSYPTQMGMPGTGAEEMVSGPRVQILT